MCAHGTLHIYSESLPLVVFLRGSLLPAAEATIPGGACSHRHTAWTVTREVFTRMALFRYTWHFMGSGLTPPGFVQHVPLLSQGVCPGAVGLSVWVVFGVSVCLDSSAS